MKKECTKCKETKSVEYFNKNKRIKDGISKHCKQCQKDAFKEYRKANKKHLNQHSAEWRKQNKEQNSILNKKNIKSVPPGVYMIKNKLTGDSYIGESVQPYQRRIQHFCKSPKIKSYSNQALQEAMEAYGREAFVFGIIEHCTEEELSQKELQYIQLYNPTYNTYLCNNNR